MLNRSFRLALLGMACAAVSPAHTFGQAKEPAKDKAPAAAAVVEEAAQEKPAAAPAENALPGPEPVPAFSLLPALKTVPVPHARPSFNQHMVDASVLPRDRRGIWVLNFTFKPVRIVEIDIPGKGRRSVYYLYYKVVNRTGKPVQFVPQFTLVTDTRKRYDDVVIPEAVKLVQAREDPTIPLLGAVNIMGVIPPSTKEGVDDAVFGVALWDKMDSAADGFHIFVRGLSDGYQTVHPAASARPIVRYKTLRIDFIRRGDERNIHEKEILLAEPAYEWVYW